MSELTINGDLYADLSQVLSYVLGLSVLRFSLSGIVNTNLKRAPCLFQVLSKNLGTQQRRKFHENLWYTLWHFSRKESFSNSRTSHEHVLHTSSFFVYFLHSFTLGVIHLGKHAWAGEMFVQRNVFVVASGYPQSASSMGFKDFYLLQLGFWLSCCVFIFFETRRKDFIEMCVHHFSTVFLISFSYLFDFARPGILIMSLHDLGDIFLYAAKSAQYRGLRTLADILFASFAISFYVARLMFLPFGIVYPLAASIWQGNSSPAMRVILSYGQGTTLTWLVAALGLLVCLHCMWGATIARMVIRTAFASNKKKTVTEDGDPRSGADSDD